VKDFFRDSRTTDDPVVQSAALSGSYAHWVKNFHDYPIYVPHQLEGVLPLSIPKITPLLKSVPRNKRTPAFNSIRNGVERQLDDCQHPHSKRFRAACRRERGWSHRHRGVTHTDIRFRAMTTKVTVQSVFRDVPRSDADWIAAFADPPNWDHAAPTFFRRTARVKYVRGAEEYELINEPASGNGLKTRASNGPLKYRLQERVEWAWSPTLSGGMINLLDIQKESLDDSEDKAKDFVKGVLKALPKSHREKVGELELSEEPEALAAYRYSLHDCIQSKFVASWHPGGLDVDEGCYRAVWSREKGSRGTLVLKAVKSIRYSKEAELFPGLSTLLNLLAPAVTSMLMNHLAFDGPCSFFDARDADREARRRSTEEKP